MPDRKRQMHLGVFVLGSGNHSAGWRIDGAFATSCSLPVMKNIAQTAERGKFDLFFISDGLAMDPGDHPSFVNRFEPLTLLSALSAYTTHVGLGATVSTSFGEPYHVARAFASLDHLSNGRFEFGTGRGSSTTEQAGFGITDPELTKDMYDEVIVEFKKMWRDQTYSFDGRFFTMPVRNVLPKPYVKPHPPMWVAAGNPGTFEKAAQLGLGVLCFTGGSPAKMAPLIELYIVYRELAKFLEGRGIAIERRLIGNYITSLEMAGCSITLLKLDDELTRLWDAPCDTPALRIG